MALILLQRHGRAAPAAIDKLPPFLRVQVKLEFGAAAADAQSEGKTDLPGQEQIDAIIEDAKSRTSCTPRLTDAQQLQIARSFVLIRDGDEDAASLRALRLLKAVVEMHGYMGRQMGYFDTSSKKYRGYGTSLRTFSHETRGEEALAPPSVARLRWEESAPCASADGSVAPVVAQGDAQIDGKWIGAKRARSERGRKRQTMSTASA